MASCPPCPTPDACYCDQALELQDRLAVNRDVLRPSPEGLRRRARCIHGEVEDVWITEAYTNRHGSGAEGTCGRGHHHLFSLTEKEYRAVSEALRQPRLL